MFYLFITSLLAAIVQIIPSFRIGIDFGPFEILMILLPLVVTGFLIWYSKHAESKRWIR